MTTPYPAERFLSVNFASDFAVCGALSIASGPVATAHLDVRVPNGFHAAWRAIEA